VPSVEEVAPRHTPSVEEVALRPSRGHGVADRPGATNASEDSRPSLWRTPVSRRWLSVAC